MQVCFKVGRGILPLITRLVKHESSTFIITDSKLEALARGMLIPHLNHKNTHLISVPQGEGSKTMECAISSLERLMDLRPDRHSTIIAFGGGVITDLAGFIASITLRGLNLINIPTSLIAQVDSAIGGKNGINTRRGKNMVGTIYNPSFTIIDTELLATLPQNELIAGYAEVAKHALINNKDFFCWLQENMNKVLAREPDYLDHAIAHACYIKQQLVANDLLDRNGSRILLNFGHTLGHAIESHNEYKNISHGEAVSLGIVFATKISKIEDAEKRAIIEHLASAGLPTNPTTLQNTWNLGTIIEKVAADKKASNAAIDFITLKTIGEAQVNSINLVSLKPLIENFFTKEISHPVSEKT